MRCKLKAFNMNTQFKVGQRVKVITACTGTDLNVNGWTGEIMEVQSDNFVGIKFAEYPLLYCFTDDGITLNVEILEPTPPTPKWLPIDRDNLPTEPVLCCNFDDKTKIVINRITINHLDGTIQSHNRREFFEVTHYILLQDLLNLPIAE